ncbi:Glia maturation factor beta [Microtus ochrogaster]|uniref:Glia maturation factor beta n=1 Tax=Microtus ochrogaster TaxID=79684 RepID=A0A8J6KY49_MICOH|nr:Glia maturation factor beta [Microtus ochrogaster]
MVSGAEGGTAGLGGLAGPSRLPAAAGTTPAAGRRLERGLHGQGSGPCGPRGGTGWTPGTALAASSESLVVCDVAEDLVEKLRKFRFRKETHNAAIIMKIDKDKRLVVLDEELESRGFSFFNLRKTFIVYSYKYQHDDGRVSYPLCFIFSSPVGCKPEQQMMYAGSKNKLVQTAELTKVVSARHVSCSEQRDN